MNGPMVAKMLRSMRPGLKVVFMSGYASADVARVGVVQDEVPFLQKPFTPDALARLVRDVLGGKP
jgi:two-component system cell cycle sensor histidine kinase/response regulator CckA